LSARALQKHPLKLGQGGNPRQQAEGYSRDPDENRPTLSIRLCATTCHKEPMPGPLCLAQRGAYAASQKRRSRIVLYSVTMVPIFRV
jgi:hypothetical protein